MRHQHRYHLTDNLLIIYSTPKFFHPVSYKLIHINIYAYSFYHWSILSVVKIKILDDYKSFSIHSRLSLNLLINLHLSLEIVYSTEPKHFDTVMRLSLTPMPKRYFDPDPEQILWVQVLGLSSNWTSTKFEDAVKIT